MSRAQGSGRARLPLIHAVRSSRLAAPAPRAIAVTRTWMQVRGGGSSGGRRHRQLRGSGSSTPRDPPGVQRVSTLKISILSACRGVSRGSAAPGAGGGWVGMFLRTRRLRSRTPLVRGGISKAGFVGSPRRTGRGPGDADRGRAGHAAAPAAAPKHPDLHAHVCVRESTCAHAGPCHEQTLRREGRRPRERPTGTQIRSWQRPGRFRRDRKSFPHPARNPRWN